MVFVLCTIYWSGLSRCIVAMWKGPSFRGGWFGCMAWNIPWNAGTILWSTNIWPCARNMETICQGAINCGGRKCQETVSQGVLSLEKDLPRNCGNALNDACKHAIRFDHACPSIWSECIARHYDASRYGRKVLSWREGTFLYLPFDGNNPFLEPNDPSRQWTATWFALQLGSDHGIS